MTSRFKLSALGFLFTIFMFHHNEKKNELLTLMESGIAMFYIPSVDVKNEILVFNQLIIAR